MHFFRRSNVLGGALFFTLLALASAAEAQGRRARSTPEAPSALSWDVGASFGSYGGYSFNELDLGLNYRPLSLFNWRNVAWDRFGSSVVSTGGVDSSARFEITDFSETLGYRLFVGPGVRISSSQYTGYFGEAGATAKVGGLFVGGGVKILTYSSPGKDPATNQTLPTQDTVLFIVIGGGGFL